MTPQPDKPDKAVVLHVAETPPQYVAQWRSNDPAWPHLMLRIENMANDTYQTKATYHTKVIDYKNDKLTVEITKLTPLTKGEK